MRRTFRLVADLALSLGALVGVVCLVAAIGSVAFGIHPLIFRSGSMSPTIPTGSLAFARDVPASDIEVGDIVSVPWQDSRVTHRVVEVFHRHGSATLKLRGDANSVPDRDLYQVSSAPRVWFSVPVAGDAVAWLSRTPGVFVLAAYAALLLSILFRRAGGGGDPDSSDENDDDRPDDPEKKPRRRRRRLRRAAGVGSAVLLLGVATTSPTWAAWTDTGAVSGSTLGTYTLPKPPVPSCAISGTTLTGQTATIKWTGVTTPYTFDYSATVAETGTALPVTHSGTAYQTTFNSGLLGTLLNQTYNVRIYTRLGTNWVSSSYSNQPVTVGLLGLSLSCGTAS